MKLDELIREHILSVLEDHNGNRTNASLALGIANRTLRNHISKYRQQGYDIPAKAKFHGNQHIKPHAPIIVDLKEEDLIPVDPEYNYFATNAERLRYLDTRRRL